MAEDKDYTDLAVKLQETQSLAKSNQHRIDNLEGEMKIVNETQISLVKIANSVENMGKSMIEVNKKVDQVNEKQDALTEKIITLENKPAQETKEKVDKVWEKILLIVVGGLTVGLLSALIPGLPW